MSCENGADYGFSTFTFMITPNGEEITTERNILYVGILIAMIALCFLFMLIGLKFISGTNTYPIVNVSLGVVTNGTDIYLTDYRALSSVVMINGTSWESIHAGNWTLTNNVIDPTTSQLSVRISPNADFPQYSAGGVWLLSATAQPTTYIADSGARSVAGLIAIFFALAIAVVALTPTLRSGVLELMGK